MDKYDFLLVRVILARMSKGENLEEIFTGYKALSDEKKEEIAGYVSDYSKTYNG